MSSIARTNSKLEQASTPNQDEIDDESRDALHILHLGIIPRRTKGLSKARLIKNARIETMVEIFKGKGIGSGQVLPANLDSVFPCDRETLKADIPIINQLASLGSFDVYTLRLALRTLNIPIENESGLSLSPRKKADLTEYMKKFTRPLISFVYGEEATVAGIGDVSDIVKMLSHPNKDVALQRLQMLTRKLSIQLADLPIFLENYGDAYLSLAYFKNVLDDIVPQIQEFVDWVRGIGDSDQLRRDKNAMNLVEESSNQLTQTIGSLTGRFEFFDRRSESLWQDMTAANFNRFRQLVAASHTSIGTVLCGLSVKMDLWQSRFPNRGAGPAKRLEFLRTEASFGLSELLQAELTAAKEVH